MKTQESFKKDCQKLKKLLYLFPETTISLYKTERAKAQDLIGIENLMEPLRAGKEIFSLKHIDIIQDKERKYWTYWGKFRKLSDNELIFADEAIKNRSNIKDCVTNLFKVFRDIEQVSIVLRFIDPINFGMFTPPVEKMIGTSRGDNHVKIYINYLNDLNEIKSLCENRFSRIADIEMALWVLSNLEKRERSGLFTEFVEKFAPEQYYRIRESLLRPNSLINRIKILNLPDDIWEGDLLEKAKMLFNRDLFLSALVAGNIIKIKIPNICKKLRIPTTYKTNGKINCCKLGTMIKKLYDNDLITEEERDNLKKAWGQRNKICEDEKSATKEEVNQIIEAAKFLLEKFKDIL